MVWDEGIYSAMEHEAATVKEQEKILLQELKKGDVKFVLHGEKLKGAFALVKMKGRGENAWLLIKKHDEDATEADITKKDKSVKTERTLGQIAKQGGTRVKKRSSVKKKKDAPKLLNDEEQTAVKKNFLKKI
jgi:bifunctional non-homologous end joining protein LigD